MSDDPKIWQVCETFFGFEFSNEIVCAEPIVTCLTHKVLR